MFMTFDGAVFDVNYFLTFVNIDDIIFGQKRFKMNNMIAMWL